ncbi:MAG: response regulator [candidate division Zixibacteria bacterium]|nr:response regulator [Candidatus Tariuqbacter arcticus]
MNKKAQTDSKPVKVLVVDDEERIVELMCQVIEAIGAVAIKAYDGEEALALINKEMPDIVFSDVYMPKLNGLALLRKLKQMDAELPVIIFTGYQHYKQIVESAEIRPDNFLEKPVDIREIIEIMLHYFPQLRK